ncbi:hypothetical protein Anas_09773, partial [Armadillidium nasatum]
MASRNFTIENFSFSRYLLGAGEPHEFERSAYAPKGSQSQNSNSERKKFGKVSGNGLKKSPPVLETVTKFSSKPQSNLHSESTKTTSFKSVMAKKTPISRSLVADSSKRIPSVQRSTSNKRKRTTLNPENKTNFSKKIKLRDRQSIQPPSRYNNMEENDNDGDDYEISGPNTNSVCTRRKVLNHPEEMVVEPDIYFDDDLEDENVRLNFPFGIDENDDLSTDVTPDITTKPLLSEDNLPPIVEKDNSKSNFPLIQLNFEDLYMEDEGGGGGGTEEPYENRESPISNSNPSKIRVRPLDELCDTTPENFRI